MSDPRVETRARLRSRLEAKYPDLSLTDRQLDNYLDAQERMKGQPVTRQTDVGPLSIERATPDRVEDVLDFFDHRAFANNPGWASCYCAYHHLGPNDDPSWDQRTWQENRDLLRSRLTSGATRAYVAYDGDAVVGWLNASNRSEFPEHATGEDDRVASIVCFTVAPTHRGHAVGSKLLEAAIDDLGAEGLESAEAYPVPDHVDDASAYRGRARMFHEAGFEPAGDAAETVRRPL